MAFQWRRWTIRCAGLAACAFETLATAQIPTYQEKPASWKSLLATDQGDFISDDDFAGWVKSAQQTAAALDQPWSESRPTFSIICSFTQCYSGGFLTELQRADIEAYGANASCKYFQSCSYDAPAQAGGSFYAFAWRQAAAGDTNLTDEQITEQAWDNLASPLAQFEQVQYVNDPAGTPPEPLGAVCADDGVNFAILYVGRPDSQGRDATDATNIFTTLVNDYGFDPADILILFGNGSDPNAIAATRDNLEKALTDPNLANGGWLIPKLAAILPLPKFCSAQVFFWSADHGTVQTPFTFSVDPASQGQPGTGVNGELLVCGPLPPCQAAVLYEGGTGTNAVGWRPASHPDWPGGDDVDALSFGGDQIPVVEVDVPGLYFSVGRDSVGQPGSGVNDELPPGAPPDVFTRTADSNRQMVDGEMSTGLVEGIFVPDDLNALSFDPISTMLHPLTDEPLVPVFFSVEGSAEIFVYDPVLDDIYVFWNLGLAVGAGDVNAIALHTPLVRGALNRLEPVPLGFPDTTRILFSVAGGDPLGPSSSVWRLDHGGGGAVVILTAANLGLLIDDDVNALHTFGVSGPTTCPWDLDGDGHVGVIELLVVLALWGLNPGGPPDFDGSGAVGIADLLKLLANWGPCP